MNYWTLGGRKLQHFYSIDIETEDDKQVVYFNSKIHVNKRSKLPTCYSTDFSHREILHDPSLIRQINDRYGKVTIPDQEAPF